MILVYLKITYTFSMKIVQIISVFLFLTTTTWGQNKFLPEDYLSKDFHKNRRAQVRNKLPKNSVAVFFSNAVRNRSNDVDYVYHQDPNFYYLTGYKEANSVVIIFKDEQIIQGKSIDEVLFVQEKNEDVEMWNGKRLGIIGAQDQLGFKYAYNGSEFKDFPINFLKFKKILFEDFKNDVRNTDDEADLYDLILQFKEKVQYKNENSFITEGKEFSTQLNKNIEHELLNEIMMSLREIKSPDEIKLLKKAAKISAIGQVEMMKAMRPDMSETEAQGVHEFVYKKYGAEFEGYPSIVGSGNNGCILHYTDNIKTEIGDKNLILMDLGAEYHGYTADVTRTIPANGLFSEEQKLIYNIVLEAQDASISASVVGGNFYDNHKLTQKIINKGLFKLGIISSEKAYHNYYPHASSHHIGLDVHDLGSLKDFKENMVITVEPGIYIPYGSPCDEKWWGIGIRIEDDILITKNGPINLSELAPRTVDAIEATMKLPSALNNFVLPNLEN